MYEEPIYSQSWLDQRRAREREAATFTRRRRQRLAALVLALIGSSIILWQTTQPQASFVALLVGIAMCIPFVATFRIKL